MSERRCLCVYRFVCVWARARLAWCQRGVRKQQTDVSLESLFFWRESYEAQPPSIHLSIWIEFAGWTELCNNPATVPSTTPWFYFLYEVLKWAVTSRVTQHHTMSCSLVCPAEPWHWYKVHRICCINHEPFTKWLDAVAPPPLNLYWVCHCNMQKGARTCVCVRFIVHMLTEWNTSICVLPWHPQPLCLPSQSGVLLW